MQSMSLDIIRKARYAQDLCQRNFYLECELTKRLLTFGFQGYANCGGCGQGYTAQSYCTQSYNVGYGGAMSGAQTMLL